MSVSSCTAICIGSVQYHVLVAYTLGAGRKCSCRLALHVCASNVLTVIPNRTSFMIVTGRMP